MWTEGEEVQQIDGGHETGEFKVGPGNGHESNGRKLSTE
jgi:hypothetical protein